ncbi:MAG: hypothetical protein ACM3N6_03590 [Betaproteobacteria bacterium]
MTKYVRADGLLIEPVGHLWAAFSPASFETLLLNDESAAILEVLEPGARSTEEVCSQLSVDSGIEASTLQVLVQGAWPRLVEAGLVRELRCPRASGT